MRYSELRLLRWHQVDLERRTVRVGKSKTEAGTGRVIPLNDFAFEAVDRISSRLLEAGEPDHVVESITGHLSRRMLEHYSHIRLNAKKAHSITGRHLQLHRLAWL